VIDHGRRDVLGIEVSAVDYEAAIDQILAAAKERRPFAVSALAVHGLMTGALDPVHRHRLNHFDLLVPDGHPVRWGLNLLHHAGLADRVYGPNLMLKLCERAASERVPIFLFGGSEALLEKLSRALQEKFPLLQIAGTRASKFRTLTEEERQELIHDIRQSGARITFVGLGCPRQEVFAYEMRDDLSMPLLAVGAAFNFHAGELAQAPTWMQDRGLEWLFRLGKEPKRLWKRYVLLNPLYLTLLGLQWLKLYKIKPGDTKPPGSNIAYG
jgi:exopolysaccharide biosynthesis WecB/TagA/CpsF family protein